MEMDLLAKVLVILLLAPGNIIADPTLSIISFTPSITQSVGAYVSANVIGSDSTLESFQTFSILWKKNGRGNKSDGIECTDNSLLPLCFRDCRKQHVLAWTNSKPGVFVSAPHPSAPAEYKNRIFIRGSNARGWNTNVISNITLTNLTINDSVITASLALLEKNITLNVKECPSYLPYNVTVAATSFTFGSSGIFSCPSNSELFFSNGTLVTSSSAQTQCLADATWSQQENLECWNAPSVHLLPANITGNESDFILLSCQASGGYPSSYSNYYFVFPGNNLTEPTSNTSIQLKKEWNQQEVYCKAITNYTVSNDNGKSLPIKMNVQYRPHYVSASVFAQTNSQIINSSGALYLNSAQALSGSCSSDSNPPAVCSWFYCSETCIIISSKCEDNVVVGISGNLSCSAGNLVGSEYSGNISLHIVPSDRYVEIRDVNGSFPLSIVQATGTVMILHCSIDFDDILMTSYSWNIQNLHESYVVNGRSIEVAIINREDGGNYTCNTADSFMSYSKTVVVNILYAPFAEGNSEVKCEWSLNQLNAVCDVPFYSNPTPGVVSLMKGDMELTGPFYQVLNTDAKDRYVFSLQRRNVLEEDFDQYIVTVSNSMYIGTINFSVVQSTSSQVNVGVIVGSVFGSLAAVALIAVSVYAVLRHQAKKTKDGKPQITQDGKLDSNTSPPPVVYMNAPETETGQVQDHTRGNTVASHQQTSSTTYENVHHYEAVGPKKQEGSEDPYIDLNI